MLRRTGAVHRPPPAGTPRLSDHADLAATTLLGGMDWQSHLTLGDALGNDTLGNCVECAQMRAEQLIVSNAMGSNWTPTAADAIGLYTIAGGYDPANPATDTGTDTARAMSLWCSQGYRVNLQLEDVPKWFTLNPANIDHMKAAISTLGCILLTLDLPRAAMPLNEWTITPDGSPDKAVGSEGGHRVMVGRYDADGLWAVTWGLQIPMSPAFVAAYCIGADVVVSRRWIKTTGMSPAGFDLAALETQAAQLA